MDMLSIRWTRQIDILLGMLWPPQFRLQQIAREVIACVQRLQNARTLHQDVSISNLAIYESGLTTLLGVYRPGRLQCTTHTKMLSLSCSVSSGWHVLH